MIHFKFTIDADYLKFWGCLSFGPFLLTMWFDVASKVHKLRATFQRAVRTVCWRAVSGGGCRKGLLSESSRILWQVRLECVAVCCSVLQCVAVCCSVLQCVAVCCSVLQCGEVCCSMLQCGEVCSSML